MQIIETTVFNFEELSDAAKEKAREWYRDGMNGDNYFAEFVIEDAAEIAGMMGLDIFQRTIRLMGGGTRQEPAVYWSGFSSQGDGACFEGTWNASGVKPGKVKEYAPADTELHRIAADFERLAKEFPQASFSVKHSDRYCHEHSVSFQFDIPGDSEEAVAVALCERAEEELAEAARDFMRWIYRQLEKEYEYQNSDTQVDESIIANDYTFTANGKRF